jgi:hypothetical protein
MGIGSSPDADQFADASLETLIVRWYVADESVWEGWHGFPPHFAQGYIPT